MSGVVTNEDLIHRARGGDREALEDLFIECHAPVVRVLTALIGDGDRALRAVDDVYTQARHTLRRWPESVDPVNWFYHRAVLASRRYGGGRQEDVNDDPLVRGLSIDLRSPAYLAMVQSIRRLGTQQAEAIILHHGERLNPRLLGVAMDCSTTAATTHLAAADTQLKSLAGAEFESAAALLRKAMVALAPPKDVSAAYGRSQARKVSIARTGGSLQRLVAGILLLGILFAAGWYFRGFIPWLNGK